MTQEHPDKPTPDDIDALLDKIDAETPWEVDDYDYSTGMYEPSELSVYLNWEPQQPDTVEITTDGDATTVKDVCRDLEGDDPAPREDVIDAATDRTSLSRDTVVAEIEKLKKKGEVYEPAADYLRTT